MLNYFILQVQGTDHPALFTETMFTEEAHWINKPPRKLLTEQMYDCDFKYQHIMRSIKCTATLSGGNSLIVSLQKPMRAINAGQYAVLFDGEVCLGSAKIRRPGPSMFTMGHREPMKVHVT
jgi:tRNA-specific 2-thiouridylase